MKFIQLCGAGRAGKSTIASILYDVAYENNYIPVILPFAKALKKRIRGFDASINTRIGGTTIRAVFSA